MHTKCSTLGRIFVVKISERRSSKATCIELELGHLNVGLAIIASLNFIKSTLDPVSIHLTYQHCLSSDEDASFRTCLILPRANYTPFTQAKSLILRTIGLVRTSCFSQRT